MEIILEDTEVLGSNWYFRPLGTTVQQREIHVFSTKLWNLFVSYTGIQIQSGAYDVRDPEMQLLMVDNKKQKT